MPLGLSPATPSATSHPLLVTCLALLMYICIRTYNTLTSTYIYKHIQVAFYKGLPNCAGTFGSKAVGEPPMLLAAGIIPAVRMAIDSARCDRGLEREWYDLAMPISPLEVIGASGFGTRSGYKSRYSAPETIGGGS